MGWFARATLLAFLVALPTASGAQPSAEPSPTGITVVGQGVTRVTVLRVMVVARVHGTANRDDPVVMLRAAGVEEPWIDEAAAAFVPGAAITVRGRIANVSVDKLDRVGQTAAVFVRTHPGLVVDGIHFVPPLLGCENFEEAARENALADAERKATAIAAGRGAALSQVVAVNESGGCPDLDAARRGDAPPPPWFDPATLVATITVSETVTYAVRDARAGSR